MHFFDFCTENCREKTKLMKNLQDKKISKLFLYKKESIRKMW